MKPTCGRLSQRSIEDKPKPHIPLYLTRSRAGRLLDRPVFAPHGFLARHGGRGTRPGRADPPPQRPVTPFGNYISVTKVPHHRLSFSRLASQARPEAPPRQSHGTPTNPRCPLSVSHTTPELHHALDLLHVRPTCGRPTLTRQARSEERKPHTNSLFPGRDTKCGVNTVSL